jgi:hypothetical protein
MSQDSMEQQSRKEELEALARYMEIATYRTVEALALADTEGMTEMADFQARLEAIRQMFLWRNDARHVKDQYLSGYLTLGAALDALHTMRDDFDRSAGPLLNMPPYGS